MRIFINLFSPKLIGQYFNEKLARVIFYVLFFLAICFIPTAVEMDKKAVVSYTDDIALIQDFKNNDNFVRPESRVKYKQILFRKILDGSLFNRAVISLPLSPVAIVVNGGIFIGKGIGLR